MGKTLVSGLALQHLPSQRTLESKVICYAFSSKLFPPLKGDITILTMNIGEGPSLDKVLQFAP